MVLRYIYVAHVWCDKTYRKRASTTCQDFGHIGRGSWGARSDGSAKCVPPTMWAIASTMKCINRNRFGQIETSESHHIHFILPQSTRNERWVSSPVWQTQQPWESNQHRWPCCPDHTPHWQSISEKNIREISFFYKVFSYILRMSRDGGCTWHEKNKILYILRDEQCISLYC